MKSMRVRKLEKILDAEILSELILGQTISFDDIDNLDLIELDNYRRINYAHVETLKISIKESGVMEPISLRLDVSEDGERRLTCISGHHRIKAVSELRRESSDFKSRTMLEPLPCTVIVKKTGEQRATTAVRSIVSNAVIRRDGVIDRARAIKKMKDEGVTNAKIAGILGVDRKTVERALSVAELPPEILVFIEEHPGLKDRHVYAAAASNRALGDTAIGARVQNLQSNLLDLLNPTIRVSGQECSKKASLNGDKGEAREKIAVKTKRLDTKMTTTKRLDLEMVLTVIKRHVNKEIFEKIHEDLEATHLVTR